MAKEKSWQTHGPCGGTGKITEGCTMCQGLGFTGLNKDGKRIMCGNCGSQGQRERTCSGCNGVGEVFQ